MTSKELIDELKQENKTLIYISGKTSTGKTTLAHLLKDQLGYSIISFDTLVRESVVEKFQVRDIPQAYVVSYRDGEPAEWRRSFVSCAKNVIAAQVNTGVILEGAIANPNTLNEIISEHANEFSFVYIHPNELGEYAKRIKNRFVSGASTNTSELPKDFWAMLPKDALEEFQKSGVYSSKTNHTILEFAKKSQTESTERLKSMKQVFPDIRVIGLLDA